MIVSEIALAVILLVGSGLLVKSFARLVRIEPGFNAAHLLTMMVSLPTARYPDEHQRVQFFKDALERIEMLPGVQSAGAANKLPIESGIGSSTSFTLDDRPEPPPGEWFSAHVRSVAGDYF